MEPSRTSIYNGSWENDQKQGKGREDMLNGGQPDGYGNTVNYFEGKFQNGQRHGEGTQFHTDGSQLKGFWKNGKLDGLVTKTSSDLTDIK
jgi:hypothetical protein